MIKRPTADQMFRKTLRHIEADERDAIREAAADAIRRIEEQEARLHAPLSRREVLEALQIVAGQFGGNGNHDSDLIANAFRELERALS